MNSQPPAVSTYVRDVCRKDVLCCLPDASVADVARRMRDCDVSGAVVCRDSVPLGIITDRDFRNRIFAVGGRHDACTAASLMNTPVITVHEESPLLEALYRMSRHDIRHLPVVDDDGVVKGLLTFGDIARVYAESPLGVIGALESARTIDEIGEMTMPVAALMDGLLKSGMRTRDVMRLSRYLNDALVLKVVEIVAGEGWGVLPPFAMLFLDAEGRDLPVRSTFGNAVVFDDATDQFGRMAIHAFAVRLNDALTATGRFPSPGGILASSKNWSRSVSEWREVIAEWISVPSPENILLCSAFLDMKCVYGESRLTWGLRDAVAAAVREKPLFLAQSVKRALRFEPPLGLFGRLKKRRGLIDLKKGGLFPVSEGIKLLALDCGLPSGGFHDRVQALTERGMMSADELVELETTYGHFAHLRLRSQLSEVLAGGHSTNLVPAGALTGIERSRLRLGFATVKAFQNFLRIRYRLELVSD